MNQPLSEGVTFQRWRNMGIEVLSPTHVRTFLAVLNGATTVRQITKITGINQSSIGSHLKRLKGLGLVDWYYPWSGQRGERVVRATVEVVDLPILDCTILGCFELGDWGTEMDNRIVTSVLDLRKGDMLTIEDHEYLVKEVRKAKKSSLATVRLDVPGERDDWWIKLPVGHPIQGRRTVEAAHRVAVANVTRDVTTRASLSD